MMITYIQGEGDKFQNNDQEKLGNGCERDIMHDRDTVKLN